MFRAFLCYCPFVSVLLFPLLLFVSPMLPARGFCSGVLFPVRVQFALVLLLGWVDTVKFGGEPRRGRGRARNTYAQRF